MQEKPVFIAVGRWLDAIANQLAGERIDIYFSV